MQQPKVERPWGGYTVLKKAESHWVKKLFIKEGERTSLQSHDQRTEIWIVLYGEISVQIGKTIHEATTGDVLFIPQNKKHRLTGIKDACVLEVAYGKVLETDITRYEDDYGRVKTLA